MITNKTNKTNLTELNKLEEYLREHGYRFERVDEEYADPYLERHQLIVYDEDGICSWDAICQRGSYGHAGGFIEVAGDIAHGHGVIGYLTAQEVIEKLEAMP